MVIIWRRIRDTTTTVDVCNKLNTGRSRIRQQSESEIAQRHPSMKRRISYIFVAVSIVASMLIVALWLRSYFVFDRITRLHGLDDSTYSAAEILSVRGKLIITRETVGIGWHLELAGKLSGTDYTLESSRGVPWGVHEHEDASTYLGFSYVIEPRGGFRKFGSYYIAIPLWPLLAITLIPSLLLARRWLRVQYCKRRGHCIICGYDLRESPERCPECGTGVVVKRGG